MKKYAPLIILTVFLLCVAAAIITALQEKKAEEKGQVEQFGYAVEGQQMIEEKEIVHNNEDYEIVWEDSALEEIIRQYLGKESGPILHSDVWDIHAVYLRNRHRFFTDKESADGYLPDTGGVISKEPLPVINSLADFAHFDSLQLLELNNQQLTDLSGLKDLENLTVLNLTACEIKEVTEVSQITGLTKLVLDDNSVENAEALADIKKLTWLSMKGCALQDITFLAELDALTFLDVGNIVQDKGSIADYTPIAELKKLEYLGLGNITDLTDISFCTGLTKLETADLENSGVDKIEAKQILKRVKTILI